MRRRARRTALGTWVDGHFAPRLNRPHGVGLRLPGALVPPLVGLPSSLCGYAGHRLSQPNNEPCVDTAGDIHPAFLEEMARLQEALSPEERATAIPLPTNLGDCAAFLGDWALADPGAVGGLTRVVTTRRQGRHTEAP